MDTEHWTLLPFAFLWPREHAALLKERVGLIEDTPRKRFCFHWNNWVYETMDAPFGYQP